MTSDLDIYRAANLLVKQHGQDAPIHAAMRADAMLDNGDLDGYDSTSKRHWPLWTQSPPERNSPPDAIPDQAAATNFAMQRQTWSMSASLRLHGSSRREPGSLSCARTWTAGVPAARLWLSDPASMPVCAASS